MRPNCPKCGKLMTRGNNGQNPRWRCGRAGNLCYQTTDPTKPVRDQAGRSKKPRKAVIFKRDVRGKTTVLVTSAQNATPVDANFLKALEAHANAVSAADILVVPYRYKNPTSRWTKEGKEDEWWDSAAVKYLCNTRKRLNSNLILMGDVPIQATAGKPLAMMDAMSHAESSIFGHPRLQLKTVPVPSGSYPKILTTTGSCTLSNYTDTKLGKVGAFHHTLGAAIIEMRGKKFHLRQINASKETGEYIDLDRRYTPEGSSAAGRAKALVLGDWHRDFALKSVEHATFGRGGMVSTLAPEVIAWHDLDDNYSTNPHHRGDFLRAAGKAQFNRSDARAELERACAYVLAQTPSDTLSVIVPSNHNDFLARWILATDPRMLDRTNRKLWCETVIAVEDSLKLTTRGVEYTDAFVYWAKQFFRGCDNVRVLERGESYAVAGIELGLHFDRGPNGARGSLQNLRRIGVKVMGGHGHGPGIDEGGYQVGTATGPLEYGVGSPSGWLNTHGLINALGKRTLLNIIGNQWRLA